MHGLNRAETRVVRNPPGSQSGLGFGFSLGSVGFSFITLK
jgi:hypothetical protein